MLHITFTDRGNVTTLSFSRSIDNEDPVVVADVTLGRTQAEILLTELLNVEAVEVIRGSEPRRTPILDGDPRVRTLTSREP